MDNQVFEDWKKKNYYPIMLLTTVLHTYWLSLFLILGTFPSNMVSQNMFFSFIFEFTPSFREKSKIIGTSGLKSR